MKCFYHPDKDAIGICYHCSRALCADCLTNYQRGLACKRRCERPVSLLLAFRGKQLERARYALKWKKRKQARQERSTEWKKSNHARHELTPFLMRRIIAGVFIGLFIALIITQVVIHSVPVRLVVTIGFCGTLGSLGIPVVLHYRRRDRGRG